MIDLKKKRYKLLGATIVVLFILSLPQIFHRNQGESESVGHVWNGKLVNGYLMPYSGANWSYFSPFSYYILDNAYTHHKVYHTIIDAYKSCELSCPNTHFRLMETSHKTGGKVHLHRTHQNGLSADFMVPKRSRKGQVTRYDYLGLSHYLINFDPDGKLTFDKGTTINFEAMGRHILAIDDAAKQHGLYIKKIILKINLKDDLYQTAAGKAIKDRDIYIVQNLTDIVDMLHDDHYHIDFTMR